jgi:DNA-binding CsgD family transcriptional regulator
MRDQTCPIFDRHLAYCRAVLADDDEAEQYLDDALADDLDRWPWPKARLELAYGAWLRRQRRVADSREPLRSARTIFELIGATAWAAQAKAELRAAGERIEDETARAHDLLSAQELQIAQLAAEGLSNREIGERLFLSPRTISTHLYRIFPKLDITSRTQLPARLAQADVPREGG